MFWNWLIYSVLVTVTDSYEQIKQEWTYLGS